MTTAPKSVQAMGGDNNRRQHIEEFLIRYRQLPDDFLRLPASYNRVQQHQQIDNLSRVNHFIAGQPGPLIDMIEISCVEAQLVKNYGLLRMDLYCKIRVGHMVCETNTSQNCAKNPKWDGVYQFALKPGIDSFHLEVYDEKQFQLDEKIAWLHEPIPQEIFQGITVERWFPLSGRLGKDKEGSVLLVLSHKAKVLGRHVLPHHEVYLPPVPGPPISQIPGASGLPVDPSIQIPAYIQPPPTPITTNTPQPPIERHQQRAVSDRPATEEDIDQLAEMFPSIDRNIIKAILENNSHDKDAAISTLLAIV